VEKEAEESHAGLRPGCSAAFGVEKHNEEHLILVAEVREKDLSIKQLDDICYAVCARVQQAHRVRNTPSHPATSPTKIYC